MQNKCKYIGELEKKISNQEKCWKILIILMLVIAVIMIASVSFKELFLDSEGNFSNEILWSALSAIGSMIAFMSVIITIDYTEKARRRQNVYEYQKQQLVDGQWRFNEQVLQTLLEIDPVKFLEVIAHADIKTFMNIGQELTIYTCSLRKVEYKLYWYYERNGTNTPKLFEFFNELNSIILFIEECVLDYSNKIIPAYCDLVEKENFLNIMTQRALNESEKAAYDLINSKYDSENISSEIVKRTQEVSGKVVKFKNEKWNNFVNLAKDVVEERKNIINETLENI